jgi:dihydropteroate synthase
MFRRKLFRLRLGSKTLVLGEQTLVMGILNVTPDSFSDGGRFFGVKKAVRAALDMQSAGADILDIGGESTRPGAAPVSLAEEIRRVLGVLQALRGKIKIPISVDTRNSIVAEIALGAGAQIINDVSGLRHDPRIADVAAQHRAPLILMHMRGTPETMQKLPFAKNVLRDVSQGLRRSVAIARRAGVPASQIVVDPGIGFGKSHTQNYQLLAQLPALARLGFPILVGTSRKSFLGKTLAAGGTPLSADRRIFATAASVAASVLNGAHIVRVHDVAEMVQVCKVCDAVLAGAKTK